MRAHAAVFGVFAGMAAAAACSSFGATDDAPDASTTDGPGAPSDSGLVDAGMDADGDAVRGDALAPLIRWSFEESGAASTADLRDTFFLYQDAGYGPGFVGGGLHCPPRAFAQTASTGTPFEIGAGDATFIVWVAFDLNSEDAGPADRYHTFFDRNMNWAAGTGNGGYGLGYVHLDTAPFVQGAVTDSAGKFTSVSGQAQLFDGAFHMVAFVVSQDALSLYADGVVISTTPLTRARPIALGSDAGPIRLCDIFSNFMRGTLDELMIFPRALSSNEITQVARDVAGNK